MAEAKIVDINENNMSQYPPTCFLNPKHEAYQIKTGWIKKRFSEGMKIKLLYLENDKKCNGFIEYVPGEFAWRAVDAQYYLFIHCIWIYPNKFKKKGYGSLLIKEVIKEAEKEGKIGVATVASDDSFMASKDLFLKNGFKSVAESKPFDLMVKKLKDGANPKFKDWETELKKYKGLHILYSKQCPWVIRSINEIPEIAKKEGLDLKITEMKTAKEAQNAPSIYSAFNLIYDGKILADHFISTRRFQNIIKKEIK
jgi:L-amino acid N-acyltransferase YncA